ncbi:hypothetical protein CK203_062908 [Vitis vinifera]|uniref:Integrase catalytic domain-containing protein n=1 Tax=Vitis vinifera TaxID=29760 RepID=A0A438FST7_VITVI|nr:hypothetical protein CK203_062908 [Vitis vinifera]
MKKNDLGEDLPELEMKPPTRVACQYRKHTRLPFPQNKAWRATQKLQLVHTDVGRPQRTPSLNSSIEHQLTTPYTPQQNGVIERKNRTLMEMTRLPTKALQQKTPFEACQNADILTKPLPKARYEFLRQRLGVYSSRDKEEC